MFFQKSRRKDTSCPPYASLQSFLQHPAVLSCQSVQEGKQHSGVVLGKYTNGSSHILLDTSAANVLVTGEMEAGKRKHVAIPTATIWKTSLLCFDPTQEIYRQTADARKNLGQSVYYFCPSEPTQSLHWNPLAEAYESWCDDFRHVECHDREVLHALTVSLFDLDAKVRLGDSDEELKLNTQLSQAACLFEWICLYFFWKHQQQKMPAPTFSEMQRVLATADFARDYQRFTERIREKEIDVLAFPIRGYGDLFSLQPVSATAEAIQTISDILLPFSEGSIAQTTDTSDITLYDLVDADQPFSLYLCLNRENSQECPMQEIFAKIFLHMFLAELLKLNCERNPDFPDVIDVLWLLDDVHTIGSFLPLLDYLKKSTRYKGLYCHGHSDRGNGGNRRVKLCVTLEDARNFQAYSIYGNQKDFLEAFPIQIHLKNSLGVIADVDVLAKYLAEHVFQTTRKPRMLYYPWEEKERFDMSIPVFYRELTANLQDKEICFIEGENPVLLETV